MLQLGRANVWLFQLLIYPQKIAFIISLTTLLSRKRGRLMHLQMQLIQSKFIRKSLVLPKLYFVYLVKKLVKIKKETER